MNKGWRRLWISLAAAWFGTWAAVALFANWQNDIFVHISAVQRAGLASLKEGQRVSFELEKDKRSGKMAATQLTPL